MNRTPTGAYSGSIIIHPHADLQLAPRQLGEFTVHSTSPRLLEATSSHVDAPNLFHSQLPQHLEVLSWDMVWERLVAVQFEPSGGRRDEVGPEGQQIVTMYMHDTISTSGGNPKHGILDSSNFGLLQTIRDRIIAKHLANEDAARNVKLMGDAPLLIAVEHLVKGVVHSQYALAEYYSVVETIENRLGNRKALATSLGLAKTDLDLITRFANEPQYDQRHAPQDAANVAAVPALTIRSAAEMARTIVSKYAQTIP